MDKVSILCMYVLLICKYLDFFKITMFFKKIQHKASCENGV